MRRLRLPVQATYVFGIDFSEFSLWLNLTFFAGAAIVVWLSGSRLARYSDTIAERTGLGEAFAGLILLAAATSLPELTTTITASVSGNAPLAAGNMLGGVAMQTAVIAVADIVAIRGALTFFTPSPTLLLQGSLLILILGITIMGASIGDWPVLGVGVWTATIFAIYVLGIYLLKNYERNETWRPVDLPNANGSADPDEANKNKHEQRSKFEDVSTKRLGVYYAAAALFVLAAGVALTLLAEAIGKQTGIGATFIGRRSSRYQPRYLKFRRRSLRSS